MDNQWISLPPARSESQEIPQLLIRTAFTSEGYDVSVTDLMRVWSESLSRRDIIKRALNENTSIDPTEDSAQLKVLLDTIKAPLVGNGGVLELASASASVLQLRVTSRLPAPLDSLSWTYQLKLAPEATLKQEIIAPIWLLAHKQQQEIQDLLRHLREKDHVISKLLDSVESSNTDLATIFPSTAGMKLTANASRREQAGQHVPGLRTFDEQLWEEEFARKQPAVREAKLKSIALSVDSTLMSESLCTQSEPQKRKGGWWEELGSLPTDIPDFEDGPLPASGEERQLESQRHNAAVLDIDDYDETESEEDEYQVLGTQVRSSNGH